MITEEEYKILDEMKPWLKNGLTKVQSGQVLNIYQKYINSQQKWTSCSPCWKPMVQAMENLYNDYKYNPNNV